MTVAATTVRRDATAGIGRSVRRNTWLVGLLALFVIVFAFTKLIQPSYGAGGVQGLAISVLLLGLVLGATNGGLVVATRVPDIVVTLAMSFVWAGCALLVRSAPGGAAS